jgi:hypothetical protein
MFHAEIYLMAQFLDINELMGYSTNRFKAVAKADFRASTCLEPFSLIFKHGTGGDTALRAHILELYSENPERLSQDEELTLLLLQHEPIAWKLLTQQAQGHASLVQEVGEMQRNLEKSLQISQASIRYMEQRVEEMTVERDRMIALLERFDRCRNCTSTCKTVELYDARLANAGIIHSLCLHHRTTQPVKSSIRNALHSSATPVICSQKLLLSPC